MEQPTPQPAGLVEVADDSKADEKFENEVAEGEDGVVDEAAVNEAAAKEQPTETEPQHSERPARKHIGNLHVDYDDDDDEEKGGHNDGEEKGDNNDDNNDNKPKVDFRDKNTKYRRWLYDRIDGSSRYNDSDWGKPPCSMCYVPVPVGWFPDLIEMNPIFERFGRVGCVDAENPRIRFILFAIALLCNFTAIVLTFLAFLSATHENFGVLRGLSFTRGVFDFDETRGSRLPKAQVDIGLRTVALDDPNDFISPQSIVHFSDFCDIYVDLRNGRKPNVFMTPEQCRACETTSFPIIFSLAISLVFIVPSITTNFLRMWPNYDVNCQKFFGAVIGTISLFASLFSWFGYTKDCFRNFESGHLVLFANFSIPNPDTDLSLVDSSELLFLDRDWSAGWGLICVVVATLLKGVDSVCNWIVPTPRITRDHNEQRAYEYLVTQGRSVSAFERLHQQHQAQEVHTGLELADKGDHKGSLWRAHRLLGIPEPEPSGEMQDGHDQHQHAEEAE